MRDKLISDQQAQSFRVRRDGVPELDVYDFGQGGKKITLEGHEALYNAKDPVARALRRRYGMKNQTDFRHLDMNRDVSPGATIGTFLSSIAKSKNNALDRLFGATGPTLGALLGAGALGAAGYGAGYLGDKLVNKINQLFGARVVKAPALGLKYIGAALGGLGGGLIGYERSNNLVKSSAMFSNPRNFILEKLQGANDLTTMQKAQLAGKIRMMDTSSAERLKAIVRAAAGFGVGALIARFFGFGLGGSFVGGVLGATANVMSHSVGPGGSQYLRKNY